MSALGYLKGSSLKPPCGKAKFLKLVDQILVDGFETAGEPMLVNQPEELDNMGLDTLWAGRDATDLTPLALGVGSLGYIKGEARATTVLTILRWTYQESIDLKVEHEKLYESIREVWLHPFKGATKLDEGLMNMKLSVRGSIRTANNIIQTVILVQNLTKHGLTDISIFTRKWNVISGRANQIVGKRAMSLKLLFNDCPVAVLIAILEHVETLTWEQACWSDDNLCNKKLFPNFQFPTKSKKWLPRIKTSEDI